MTRGATGHWLIIVLLLAILARTANAADNRVAGKKLYTAKCARCHQFYDPVKYDESSWNTWMEKMRRKARLNDEQYKRLSEYLETVRSEAAQKPSAAATR